MRNLIYRRSQREKHIKRKEYFLRKSRIDNPPHKYNDADLFGPIYFPKEKNTAFEGSWEPYWIVNHRGKLNKGKIHCSCPLCSAKTRNKSGNPIAVECYDINHNYLCTYPSMNEARRKLGIATFIIKNVSKEFSNLDGVKYHNYEIELLDFEILQNLLNEKYPSVMYKTK